MQRMHRKLPASSDYILSPSQALNTERGLTVLLGKVVIKVLLLCSAERKVLDQQKAL